MPYCRSDWSYREAPRVTDKVIEIDVDRDKDEATLKLSFNEEEVLKR